MPQIEYYSDFYEKFSDEISTQVRREAFGEYFGQNSALTADEYRAWLPLLNVKTDQHVLEVACGSGGPALFLANTLGCRLTGVDSNENGVATANQLAEFAGLQDRVRFQTADANQPLPFSDSTFDGLVCIDAVNHLADRKRMLHDWHRLLKPGARILYTDPIVVTGPMSNAEIATRSSIGFYVFMPSGENEKLLEQTGFRLVHHEDATETGAQITRRWQEARERHREGLIKLEGQERFEGMQAFFTVSHRLTSERRLSRMAYIAEKALR